MARTATYNKKINVVEALKNLDNVSYFLRRQLVEEGYLTATKNPEAKTPGRGRMPLRYDWSPKGANLVRLSANWKPKQVETAEQAQA